VLDQKQQRLICTECGTVSDEWARGWRVLLVSDDDAVAFCHGCAMREFDSD
jgi:hypothetical protein